MQTAYGKPTRKMLEEIDPAIKILVLDDSFAAQEPGEAAEKMLEQINGLSAQ
jgi:hypothetical protein